MKKSIVLLITITAAFTTFAQKEKNQMQKPKTDTAMQVKYTCPMYPDVVMDKPVKCPKCGMDLTRSKNEKMKGTSCKNYSERKH
jgi:transcription initiation factor IIE alpha subunit